MTWLVGRQVVMFVCDDLFVFAVLVCLLASVDLLTKNGLRQKKLAEIRE
jgi:hypothetical protein